MNITIKADIHPTEDPSKVKEAVLNIFPNAELEPYPDRLEGTAVSLDLFLEMLAKQRIRDTARDQILRNREGSRSSFLLNKQTALVGRVGFSEPGEGALGSIEVAISPADWEGLIEFLTPPPFRSSRPPGNE